MTLQETFKNDLTTAIKSKDEVKKNTLRVILGEFGRMDRKVLPDDDVIKILKKLIKSEKETLEKLGKTESSDFIRIIESYLPHMATESEIRIWIDQHIDFSQFKNKMQAMRPIMTHFGASADGNIVQRILQSL